MRILVIPSWYPTAERPFDGSFFREQAQMMAESGHRVSVLAPRIVPAQQWRGTQAEISQEGPLRVIRCALPAVPRLLQRFEQRVMGRMAVAVLEAAGEPRPDVVHAHSVMPAVLLAQELSIRCGIPFVLTEHRPSSMTVKRSRTRAAHIRNALDDAAVVASVSAPFSRALGAHYGIRDPEVIELPVPEAFFESPPVADIQALPYTFLHVSHLDENKRVEETLDAFAGLSEADNARMVVAGGTPERVARLRRRAEELGISARVDLLGQVQRHELPSVMARSHCFILASAVESAGAVLCEAKSTGLPIVVTRTWGGVSVAVEDQTDLLVPIDEPAALIEAMQSMLDRRAGADPRERSQIREHARARYSAKAFTSRQASAYSQAKVVSNASRMIFHAPYPIDPKPSGASRLRPLRMLEAFEHLGMQVHQVTGGVTERAIAFRAVKRRVRNGQEMTLLYSENSTQPNLLATSIRRGMAPLLDARIFWWARRRAIPSGEFYRDIYWRHSTSLRRSPTLRTAAMRLLYEFDLAVLRVTGVHLFLPSERMAPEVPVAEERSSALPPGARACDSTSPSGLHLLYVGGLGEDYGLDACLEAVAATGSVSLTMCVPESHWEKNRPRYEHRLSDRIRVIHRASHELGPLYDEASACVLFVEPSRYRTFAAPVKFFEYLGYGKPVLVSEGTYAGELAALMGIGPVIPYSAEALRRALQELEENPVLLQTYRKAALEAREHNTWLQRARTVVERLVPGAVPVLRGGRG